MPYNSLLWWRAFALLSTWKELGVQFLGATGSPGGREEVMYLGPSWENTKRKIPGGPWLGRVFGEENVYWDFKLAAVCKLR